MLKKYKMLCLDIDGTLLNSNNKISSKTRQAINILSNEKDVRVVLVSARMPKGIDFLQKELDIKEPIICYSGSLLLDKNYKTISQKYIKFDIGSKIINEAKKNNIHISLYNDNEWIIEKMDKWAQIEADITGIAPKLASFNSIGECGINKILLIEEPDKIKAINKKLNESFGDCLNIYQSKPTYLEIMSKSVSKTSAIKQLINIYGIDVSEVVAVGDNYNDMDMLKFAGVGIAMGNAPDEVKKVSDGVTLSNDEDGVRKVIEEYFYI